MGKKWEHFKTITRHKAVVFHECKACGLTWQGITHDLSKYSPTEFRSSAEYFQGDRSPIEAEKECCGYSLAWQHHSFTLHQFLPLVKGQDIDAKN